MSKKIRVVVADDHPIVRQGVVALLEDESDIEVVANVADGRAALSAVLAEDPDVVLMDLRMPVMDGVEATKAVRARRPEVAVLVLTTYDTDEAIVRAVEAGAAGYMLKDSPTEDLVDAVRRAAAGETVLAPPITKRLVERMHKVSPDALTAREIEVLREVAFQDLRQQGLFAPISRIETRGFDTNGLNQFRNAHAIIAAFAKHAGCHLNTFIDIKAPGPPTGGRTFGAGQHVYLQTALKGHLRSEI